MTDNLPDRDTLARVIRDGWFSAPHGEYGAPSRKAADAVLDHLRATSPPPTPATDGLRERIEEVLDRMETWPVQSPKAVAWHVRSALDGTDGGAG